LHLELFRQTPSRVASKRPTGWQPPRAPTQGSDRFAVAHNEDYGGLKAADLK